MTGEAKITGAIAYLQDALEGSSEQMLVFAHHQAVLDAMEQALNRGKTKYIRIDGSTPTAERHRLGRWGVDWCGDIGIADKSSAGRLTQYHPSPPFPPSLLHVQSRPSKRTQSIAWRS